MNVELSTSNVERRIFGPTSLCELRGAKATLLGLTTGAGYASGTPLPGLFGIGPAADSTLSTIIANTVHRGRTDSRGRCAGGRSGAAARSRGQRAEVRGQAAGSIRCWIVGATGFRQSLDRPTGLELLCQELRSLSSPEVCVLTPQAWDADAEALAEYIARNSAPGATVFFYGYSYGVGHFFIKFARALNALGMGIAMAVSCDGIRRFRAAKPLSLRFFNLFVTIPVPANVAVVYAFRQSEARLLRGHRLVAEDATHTTIHDCPLRGYDHYDIDESQSFRRVVLTEARDLIHQTNNQL